MIPYLRMSEKGKNEIHETFFKELLSQKKNICENAVIIL